MATDIFICTYGPDATWLEYCFRSIDKYARGFRQTVVVYPRQHESVIGPICRSHPNVLQRPVDEPEGKGHLFQNAVKTSCDLYSDADYFLHMDSDCMFISEAMPTDYATDGKPDLWYDYYENLTADKVPGGVPWRQITERALEIPITVETMRRFPILYPRWLYWLTRARIEKNHGMPFLDYVMTAPLIGGAFHGYSEFNALGCMAFYQQHDQFKLRAMSEEQKPTHVKQFWSHWIRQNPEKFKNEILPELEQITAPHDPS